MGDDDANEDGPGECPGHEYGLEQVVVVPVPGSLIGRVGLAFVHTCVWCGATTYEPSSVET